MPETSQSSIGPYWLSTCSRLVGDSHHPLTASLKTSGVENEPETGAGVGVDVGDVKFGSPDNEDEEDMIQAESEKTNGTNAE